MRRIVYEIFCHFECISDATWQVTNEQMHCLASMNYFEHLKYLIHDIYEL